MAVQPPVTNRPEGGRERGERPHRANDANRQWQSGAPGTASGHCDSTNDHPSENNRQLESGVWEGRGGGIENNRGATLARPRHFNDDSFH